MTDYTFSVEIERNSKEKSRVIYRVISQGITIAHSILYSPSTEGDGPWISGLYVNPSHRRCGVAYDLFKRIESDYKGKVIRCRARPYKDQEISEEILLKIYKKWGFHSYDPEEPTRLMKRTGE